MFNIKWMVNNIFYKYIKRVWLNDSMRSYGLRYFRIFYDDNKLIFLSSEKKRNRIDFFFQVRKRMKQMNIEVINMFKYTKWCCPLNLNWIPIIWWRSQAAMELFFRQLLCFGKFKCHRNYVWLCVNVLLLLIFFFICAIGW